MKGDRKKAGGGGKKVERKKTIVTTAKAKKQQQDEQPPHRPSKYVGVTWKKKKWQAQIKINGKVKNLGYYHDEKEAARIYDEQAALLGKPVNFPLHEGMEQAVKRAPKGSGKRMQKSRAKSSNDDEVESDDESMEEQDDNEALDDDDDDGDEIDNPIIMGDEDDLSLIHI